MSFSQRLHLTAVNSLQPVNTNSHRSIAKRAGRQRELAAKIRSRERGQGQGYTDGASARCKAQKYRREIETAKRRFSSDPRCDFCRRRRDLLSYRERMLGSKEYYRCLEIVWKIDNESRK
ncbi:hypothetical protein C8J57DRAFT_1247062 [Mycena rebaudengoi]|nr:hypothetical protein C8J57DRAFT_1247062 [Mycena rebaudengoi]